MRRLPLLLALAPALWGLQPDPATPDPTREYRVFVGSEATDRISLVVFGPEGARVEREFSVSRYPTEADGPHGLAMAPDGSALFVTTGHGRPFGNLWKVDPETGRTLGRVELGLFPASLDLSPDGSTAYVANFNLHGDMIPSSVSVVDTRRMIEVSRLETCTMPHGSRVTTDGRRHYSTCMMDDLLVEVDAWGLAVARRLDLAPAAEGAGAHGDARAAPHGHGDSHVGDHAHPAAACSPTWAQPSPDGRSVYVACNGSGELVEVQVEVGVEGDGEGEGWRVERRIPAAPGIYTFDLTSDGGTLVAANKQDHSVSFFELPSGQERHRTPTSRRVVHGVVISPDDLYAFVTLEGVGSEPGTLEVLALATGQRVATVDLPPMSAGLAFWR